MRRPSHIVLLVVLTVLLALCWWVAHLPGWVWHPLFGRGYQLWSGIVSDVSEITFPVEIITVTVAVWRFLHQHFECHEETCHRLGFHRVPGTSHWTCWSHHPVLSEHDKHGVPLHVIHERHHAAKNGG